MFDDRFFRVFSEYMDEVREERRKKQSMISPYYIKCNGLLDWRGDVRLEKGTRIQAIHFSAGQIRYRYGNITSPALYPAVTGAGPIMVHPGTEVFIEASQAANTDCFIHIVD